MEQTNNKIKSFPRMESAWVFNVGLLFLMISISKIKHSSFPRLPSVLKLHVNTPTKQDRKGCFLLLKEDELETRVINIA